MIKEKLYDIILLLSELSLEGKIDNLNYIKQELHKISPFKNEPVDCVLWKKNNLIQANDYNPNSVAPPEMKLLEMSILQDGYTQPIVSWEKEGLNEVVDGFHRNRVGKESKEVCDRIYGYLPIVTINQNREELGDRMVSTIRHNRARGKHNVDSMSDIVVELKKRNWSEEKISKNLGMQIDEITRLCQISGLTEMFKDCDFSYSWDLNDAELKESDELIEESLYDGVDNE